jgi:hypothetical protein
MEAAAVAVLFRVGQPRHYKQCNVVTALSRGFLASVSSCAGQIHSG